MPTKKRSAMTKKQIDIIRHLATASQSVQKSSISRASRNLIKALCEGAINIIKGNIRLTQTQFRKLQPYQQEVRHLANSKLSIARKKKILTQNGGFLGLLLKPLAGILGGLLGGLGGGQR